MRKIKNSFTTTIYNALMLHWAKNIDIYLVGYPKTGNTWMYVMLSRFLVNHYALQEEKITEVLLSHLRRRALAKIPSKIPIIHPTHNMACYNTEHWDEMKMNMSPFKKKKVLLLIREPKDTLVSLYFHNRFRSSPPLFQGSLYDMVLDPIYGIQKYLRFYKTWYTHLEELNKLFLVKYEELLNEPFKTLYDIALFMGLNEVEETKVQEAVSFASFKNMKKMEAGNFLNIDTLAPPKSGGNEGFKVRQGKVGGYKEYLSPETIRYIDNVTVKELPEYYGYRVND
jgi:hypothetical protein